MYFPIFYFTTACQTGKSPTGRVNHSNLLVQMFSSLSRDFRTTDNMSNKGNYAYFYGLERGILRFFSDIASGVEFFFSMCHPNSPPPSPSGSKRFLLIECSLILRIINSVYDVFLIIDSTSIFFTENLHICLICKK